jgi:hypothetical protein
VSTANPSSRSLLWGEVVQEIRNFHLDLVNADPKLVYSHSPDYTLYSNAFPFPESNGDMDDWEPIPLPATISNWIEFHPVERALLEGPLLPIHRVFWNGTESFNQFCTAVTELERTWSTEHTPPLVLPLHWEQELSRRLLRIQTRAGMRMLRQA